MQTKQCLCFLESIISKLAIGEISIFWPVSVAGETGSSLPLSETPKMLRPIYHLRCKLAKLNLNFTAICNKKSHIQICGKPLVKSA